MKYTENYKIKWHDTNAERSVRHSQYLVYMQETANLQLRSAGRTLDDIRDEDGLAFILSKIKLIFHKSVAAYDSIDVSTWTCESRGFRFDRCFEIKRGEELIAEATSQWALIDIGAKKLVKTDALDLGVLPDEPLNIDIPRRIAIPAEGITLLGEREIRYSDVDYNMHMNNTKYPDMLCDFMPREKIGRIKEMTLEFLRESALGDKLSFYRYDDGCRYCFKTVNPSGDVCLVAEVITE